MTRTEIEEYVLKYSGGKSGLDAIGPVLDQIVSFIHWQHQLIEDLQVKVEYLENNK